MLYRYKIIPRSPLITPLMSDTFFGHFCWAIIFSKGEGYLTNLLDSYGDGKPSPVLFSSAFFSDHLPRPSLPSLNRQESMKFIRKHFGEDKAEQYKGLTEIKEWNKRHLISLEQWQKLKSNYSEEGLFEAFVKQGQKGSLKYSELEVSASNIINRISGTVAEEGGLFQREKVWYYKETEFDLYVEIGNDEMTGLVKWFLEEHLPEHGFGADKSTGMGSLSISEDLSFDPGIFNVDGPNARLSLSMTAFTGIEKYDALYRLKTKFGKLGGNFAVSSPTGGNPKPFKKPVLMYEPGAVFLCFEALNNKALLSNVHSDSRIRHCGVPITLPFKIREDIKYVRSAA